MKKMRFFELVLVFVAVVMLAGCAHYGAKGVVPQCCDDEDVSTSIVRVEKEGVRVAVFPIITKKDARKYFGENIIKEGVLAVYLNISNETSDNLKIASLNLRIAGGQVVVPSNTDAMYGILKRDWGLKAIIWAFPTYFVGGPVSALHTAYVNKKIRKDLEEKQLELGREIKPKEAPRGFVWFRIPEKAMSNDDLPKEMVLSLIIEKEGRLIKYDLLIS